MSWLVSLFGCFARRVGKALLPEQVADFAIAPEFADAVERGIVQVGIRENGFDEELILKFVVGIFIAI